MEVFVVGFVLCGCVSISQAAEEQEAGHAAETIDALEMEKAPAVYYATAGDFFLGYSILSSEDSLKAAEFMYPHSAATFGLNLLSCPLPFRYHVNAEFLSSQDFYSDAGFAYKDLVLFRDILVGARHNLPHLTYQFSRDIGDPLTDPIPLDRNPEDKYYTAFTSNLLSLRLKAPDFPLHAFVNQRHVEWDGTVQQRFLVGSYNNAEMFSQSRDIDWRSNALTLGANSHLGPVELEYAYDQARFAPGGNNILYDNYPIQGSMPAGLYPHNVVPETESSAHSLKLHSSYTGGIVTAATLSNLYQKNNYSLTESTTWKGAFDFSWIPAPRIGLFFKYRHKEVDMNTPDVVSLAGISNQPVREGISYEKDVFSLSTRYKPLSILALFATYEFSHLEQKDIAEWFLLPGQTNIHSLNFTAQARPLNTLKVKASYEYKHYNQPTYNNLPDNSNKLRLTTTYTPSPWASIFLEYLLAVTERSSLLYKDSSALLHEDGETDGRRDQFLASLSTQLSPKTSLTASWFYQRWSVEQDLAYRSAIAPSRFIDAGVPYTDKANSFALSLQYLPQEDLTLTAGLSYTIAEGTTGYNDVVGSAPFSLSSFSAMKTAETGVSLAIAKRLSKDWEIGLRSNLDLYNDKAYNLLDGQVFTATCRIKRYF